MVSQGNAEVLHSYEPGSFIGEKVLLQGDLELSSILAGISLEAVANAIKCGTERERRLFNARLVLVHCI